MVMLLFVASDSAILSNLNSGGVVGKFSGMSRKLFGNLILVYREN